MTTVKQTEGLERSVRETRQPVQIKRGYEAVIKQSNQRRTNTNRCFSMVSAMCAAT